jgi:hypothetical protein
MTLITSSDPMQEKEREQLRTELAFLKSCQIRYFELAIIAAGAVLAVAGQLAEKAKPVVYLAPLLVVVPCWWVFFDKATTITRIVGYSRLLEAMLRRPDQTMTFAYVGWENALAVFRLEQQPRLRKQKLADYRRGISLGFRHGLTFKSTQRYWIINWYTFLLLGVACWIVAWRSGMSAFSFEGLVAAAALILSTIHNLSVLGHLVKGDYSYDGVQEIWRRVLQSSRAHQYLENIFQSLTRIETPPDTTPEQSAPMKS